MSTYDTLVSWQKGRGKGGNARRDCMIQDVLLSIPVLSSVFILIWQWELIDYSKKKFIV